MRKRAIATVLMTATAVAATTPAEAAPDPTIATLLSTGGTLLPLALSAGMFYTGRGADEGVRLDVGMTSLGVGSIVGPSLGQFYAGGSLDAVLVMLLRGATSAVMLTGVRVQQRGSEDRQAVGNALFVVGGIPTALLALWDILTAAETARQTRYRSGHRRASLGPVTPELLDITRCGPIPCPVRG